MSDDKNEEQKKVVKATLIKKSKPATGQSNATSKASQVAGEKKKVRVVRRRPAALQNIQFPKPATAVLPKKPTDLTSPEGKTEETLSKAGSSSSSEKKTEGLSAQGTQEGKGGADPSREGARQVSPRRPAIAFPKPASKSFYDNNPGARQASRPIPIRNGRPVTSSSRPSSGGGRPSSSRFNDRGGASRPTPGGSSSSSAGGKGRVGGGQRRDNKRSGSSRNRSAEYRRPRQQEKEISYASRSSSPSVSVPKSISIMEHVSISSLAKKMNLKASEIISKLMRMGMMVTINQVLDSETATILAQEYGCEVSVISLYDQTVLKNENTGDKDLRRRPPVITIMGHVDHGKTQLLDTIRKSDIVQHESGGITQHIGAYTVNEHGHELTFIDTPGHETFSAMRQRGAQVTDIVVLIVSAVEGVMPQTKEAAQQARDAGVPIIVAMNKVDLPEADLDKTKASLSEIEIVPSDWGGDTTCVPISALRGNGIEELLDAIWLQSELLDLEVDWAAPAHGVVLESAVDPGRGTVMTVLVQEGILKVSEPFLAGTFFGKVRALIGQNSESLKDATPSTAVQVLGAGDAPKAGAPFQVARSEKEARQIASRRQELQKISDASAVTKVTAGNLYERMSQEKAKSLNIIIKADVRGSVEALESSLVSLSNSEVTVSVIQSGVGAVVESDIRLAAASQAFIVCFNVRPTPKAAAEAESSSVIVKKYSVIYEAINDVTLALEGILEPDKRENILGKADVRQIFSIPKLGKIAGSFVTEGVITNKSLLRVYREDVLCFEGAIGSLKRVKDNVKEVKEGFECGIGVDSFDDLKIGDIIEAYEIQEIKRSLKDVKNAEQRAKVEQKA